MRLRIKGKRENRFENTCCWFYSLIKSQVLIRKGRGRRVANHNRKAVDRVTAPWITRQGRAAFSIPEESLNSGGRIPTYALPLTMTILSLKFSKIEFQSECRAFKISISTIFIITKYIILFKSSCTWEISCRRQEKTEKLEETADAQKKWFCYGNKTFDKIFGNK